MTPSEKKIRVVESAEGLPAEFVERHLQRLDPDYWIEFPWQEIVRHLIALQSLTPHKPFHVNVDELDSASSGLTLIGGDFPGFFAAVTGFLAGLGYDIRAGKAFTFASDPVLPVLPQGGIIDFLVLQADGEALNPEAQGRVCAEMEKLFARFGAGEAAAIKVDLYRRMGERLERQRGLFASDIPLDIQYHARTVGTEITIRGPDHEAMLFCIAGALSLQGWSLEKLLTRSRDDGTFEDRLTVRGNDRGIIPGSRDLEKIRLGIALMERLLETLPAATDLQAAAEGMQALVADWLEESEGWSLAGAVDPLPALSRVLTAGTRMWDTVHRLGPQAFRSLLAELAQNPAPKSRDQHLLNLKTAFTFDLNSYHNSHPDSQQDSHQDFAALSTALNATVKAYREREILRAELDLLLTPSRDLNDFSSQLLALAEALLSFSAGILTEDLSRRHGKPGGHAFFALGKFGGEELGPGSDLEILCVYAESGETPGPEGLRQGEFFERLMQGLLRALECPPGETFALDLRLRPHGESGPLAAAFTAWRNYFAPGGGAFDFEKQALIRLRPLFGDADLVPRVLQARDAIAFTDPPVPIAHTLELHAQQIALKTKTGMWNAKYSPGGMVELEYAVQFLQLAHGSRKTVRHSNLARALEALLDQAVLTLAEFEHLATAHFFLRRLLNALRMVRGRAADSHCPPAGSPEFSFLAKRLGYTPRPGSTGETQLERDWRNTQRVVQGFFRYRFQGGGKPEWLYDSIAEALMDAEAGLEEAAPALLRLGMRDLPRARKLFLELFATLTEKRLAAACLLHFERHFRTSPDPEGVLQRWLHYLQTLPHPDIFIRQALYNPSLLNLLFLVFAHSEALTESVMRAGDSFKDLAQPETLRLPRLSEDYQAFAAEATAKADSPGDGSELVERLCRLRNREYLRIALRDLALQVHLQKITLEISDLSDALLGVVFSHTLQAMGLNDLRDRVCVLALGKLGGRELNYSSDIDLVFVLDSGRDDFEKAGRALIEALTRETPEGRLFRVDMNLRPWGNQGPLAIALSQAGEYFAKNAGGWELQAWLKARPICGQLELGNRLVQTVHEIACAPENRERVESSMKQVRGLGLDKLMREDQITREVKLGPGGIRTVEFVTQALQIRHGANFPELRTGNTLEALGRLRRHQLLPESRFQLLSNAYVFLRRIEHRLQLQGLQQRHSLPADSTELDQLAKRMGFEDHIGAPAVASFLEQYRKHMLSLQPISAEWFGH